MKYYYFLKNNKKLFASSCACEKNPSNKSLTVRTRKKSAEELRAGLVKKKYQQFNFTTTATRDFSCLVNCSQTARTAN